jgi:tetratricopeptide (TPR) repeat protein
MAYNNRGAARFVKGNLDEALTDYDRAILIDPRYANAYRNRAVLKLVQGKPADAEKDFDQCRRLESDSGICREDIVKRLKHGLQAK